MLHTSYAWKNATAPRANNCFGQMWRRFPGLLRWEPGREFLNRLGSPVTDAFFVEPGDISWWWCDEQVTANIRVASNNFEPLRRALWQATVLPPYVVFLDCTAHEGNQAFHLCLREWTTQAFERVGRNWLRLIWRSIIHGLPYKKTLWGGGQLTCNGKISKCPCWVGLTGSIGLKIIVRECMNGDLAKDFWVKVGEIPFEVWCSVDFCYGLWNYDLIFILEIRTLKELGLIFSKEISNVSWFSL